MFAALVRLSQRWQVEAPGVIMNKEIMTWQEIGDTICGHALSPKAELVKIELCNLMRKTDSRLQDGDIAVLLLVIGESMLRDLEA